MLEGFPTPLLIDVSLRDGGYLNNWSFSRIQILNALSAGQRLGADFVEIGYFDDRGDLPVAASWKPQHLETLVDFRQITKIAAMCRPTVQNPIDVVSRRRDFVDLIRIPVDVRNTTPANRLADICEQFGVAVTFNLTSITSYEIKDLVIAYEQLSTYASGVYLADSRGALKPDDIIPIAEALHASRDFWLGFHAHNNLGLARENTQKAIECGFTMIDGSLCGIGLGGRNLDLVVAIELLRLHRKDLPSMSMDFSIDEEALGVPKAGSEISVFALSGERNLKMEWIAMMIEQLGLEESYQVVKNLPKRAWLDHRELEHEVGPIIWSRLVW
jgi:4-hydroxy 2-oxovalerate aldolase